MATLEGNDLSHDDKGARGNNGRQRTAGGYNGGCRPSENRYNDRRGPGSGPGSGGGFGSGGAQRNPYVAGSHNAGDLSGGNSSYDSNERYGGAYQHGGGGGFWRGGRRGRVFMMMAP